MTKYRPFLYDTEQFFINDKSFCITGKVNDIKYLIAVLNSWVFEVVFKYYFPELLDETRELRKIFFENLPIPRIEETEKKKYTKIVDDIVANKKDNTKKYELEQKLDNLMFLLFNLTKEEIIFVKKSINKL